MADKGTGELIIMVRLPDATPGQGYLTVRQGEYSVMAAIEYQTAADIWAACEREAARLTDVIAAPPPEPPAEATKPTKKAGKSALETVAKDETEEDENHVDANE